jgi:uncharacterized protein
MKIEVEELLSRGCADAVIVTGAATGHTTSLDDLKTAKEAAGNSPVFAGSGVDVKNVADVMKIADGAIVGTAFKKEGVTTGPVELNRVKALMNAVSGTSRRR